jgi:hypothetical protein
MLDYDVENANNYMLDLLCDNNDYVAGLLIKSDPLIHTRMNFFDVKYKTIVSYNCFVHFIELFLKEHTIVEIGSFYTETDFIYLLCHISFDNNTINFIIEFFINLQKGHNNLTNSPCDVTNYDWAFDNYNIFKLACKYSSLSITKQIYNFYTDFDITMNNHELLDYVNNNSILFISWFISLRPDVYVLLYDHMYMGYYICVIKNLPISDDEHQYKPINENCPICYENSDVVLNCNHGYCYECVNKWFHESPDEQRCAFCCKDYNKCYRICNYKEL